MAVAFDAVGPSAAGASSLGSTSLTWSHTCTGSDRCLIVGVALSPTASDAGFATTATYNGVAMTSIGLVHSAGNTSGYVQMFRLAGPATGANTVAVTATGGTPDALSGGSVSFTGVDQTTPVGTAFTANSPGVNAIVISASVTGTVSGNFVVSTICDGSGGEVATTGTLRWSRFSSSASAAGSAAMSTIAAPGGTQAMSWTANSDWLGEVAVEVLAVAAAPAVDDLRLPVQIIRVP